MHSRSLAPIRYGPFILPLGMDNGLDWTTIGQERDHNHDEIHWFAQALEHRSSASGSPFFACFATIPLPLAIMDDDVAQTSLASCRTHPLRAKVSFKGPLT